MQKGMGGKDLSNVESGRDSGRIPDLFLALLMVAFAISPMIIKLSLLPSLLRIVIPIVCSHLLCILRGWSPAYVVIPVGFWSEINGCRPQN